MRRAGSSGRWALSVLVVAFTTACALAEPPGAPSGLVATGDESRVLLDWDDNVEADLAGYRVYRSASSGGPYDELTGFSPAQEERLQNVFATADTGEKPQSKVWSHAGFWWCVLPTASGSWIHRLDGTSWTPTLQLSSSTTAHADCRAVGAVTHVLLYDGVGSRLASVEYDSVQQDYAPWSERSAPTDITLSSGVETATIEVDSTGRMWVASDAATSIEVRYSDPPYSSWSGPITLASGVTTDDICVVAALPSGRVGVLWSNQASRLFGFRTHLDGAAPGDWSADETPASQSALPVGAGMADDHLNVAVASDDTLYAAVKTSYDTAGYPKIALLVRRPDGTWDPLYEVDGSGTRPIVVLAESSASVRVVYTASEGYHDIVYKESSTESLGFGARQVLLSGGWNNVTSTRQDVSGGAVFLAADSVHAVAGVHEVPASAMLVPGSDFIDSNVTPEVVYYYVVTAENTAGEESAPSLEAFAAALLPQPPAAPTDLEAVAVSETRVDLTWIDASGDEDGFSVERSLDGTVWAEIDSVPRDATTSSDTSVPPLATVDYRVRAFNSAGFSAYSNVASVTTPGVALATAVTVPVGTLAGAIEATYAADGSSQSLSETSTGSKGRAGLAAEYTLQAPAAAGEITGLVLKFRGNWTDQDAADPVVAAIWNAAGSRWEDLEWNVPAESVILEENLSGLASEYVDGLGRIIVRFTDTADIEKESKDTLAVDWLVAFVDAGPDLPPEPPGNVQADPGDTLLDLAWDPAPDADVVAYRVLRDGGVVAETVETTFTDTGLTSGTDYTYTLVALDAGGQASEPSAPLVAAPLAALPPRAPSDTLATAGSGQVSVSWSGNLETNVSSYEVYRSTTLPVALDSAHRVGLVAHLGSGVGHEYLDTDVNVDVTTTFHYVVTAVDTEGDVSAASGTVSATLSVSGEDLIIVTAEYQDKPRKLNVVATSTLGGSVTLSLHGGADEASIDWESSIVSAMSYDPALGVHKTSFRTTNPPLWVGVTSSGGGTPATAPVAFP